jgi:hypothetical protein
MSQSGFYRNRHYTEYVDTVMELKRNGNLDEAEELLLSLVAATEAESRNQNWGVAPWYYEQLALICRNREPEKELKILERFSKQQHAPGDKPAKLLKRLRELKAQQEGR